MKKLEMKILQYQEAIGVIGISAFLIVGYWLLSLQFCPELLPLEFFGIDFSSIYLYLNILSVFVYFITALLFTSPKMEKYMKKDIKKFPFGNIERLCALSLFGIIFTVWNAITEWNIIVMLQTTTFFILILILIIWVIWDAKKNHIPLRMILEKKPELKSDDEEFNELEKSSN